MKVLDFGVAKMKDQRTLTLPGIVKGKPLYMSPEQATAESIDRRSDLFSMGLILYESLLSRRAFDQGDDTKTMESIVADTLVRPVGLPTPLWDIIDCSLQKDPQKRFATALEMAQALRAAQAPMSEPEMAELLSSRFPGRVTEVQEWEKASSTASKTEGRTEGRR